MERKRNRLAIFFGITLIPSVFMLILCLAIYFGMMSERAEAEAFLLTQPSEVYINESIKAALTEGSKADEIRDDSVLARYTSPEGINFLSKSEAWDTFDLELLYKELIQNKHGEELYALSTVMIYPQKDDKAAATHQDQNELCFLPFDHPILPPEFEIEFFYSGGVITLYNGDEKTTVADMASNLSHEYGHHYTFYHMFDRDDESMLSSRYAVLRGFNSENAYTDRSDDEFYYNNHYRYLVEMAAEDYVTLMGSPASREIKEYTDVMERLYTDDDYYLFNTRSSNVQENLSIPMACEVEGLADYFYSFIGEETPTYDIKKEMNIRIAPVSRSYNLTTGYRTFRYYTVEWDKVYGEDATYVLSVYDPEDLQESLYPVRTVTSGEVAKAYIGNVVRNLGTSVLFNDDELAEGTKVFIVNVITPDGKVYTSAPYTHIF